MNVEETSLQVESAHMELLKYFKNISKNRWLAVKVFGTLIVFFIIFIVFLA
jgi:syntaxin 5